MGRDFRLRWSSNPISLLTLQDSPSASLQLEAQSTIDQRQEETATSQSLEDSDNESIPQQEVQLALNFPSRDRRNSRFAVTRVMTPSSTDTDRNMDVSFFPSSTTENKQTKEESSGDSQPVAFTEEAFKALHESSLYPALDSKQLDTKEMAHLNLSRTEGKSQSSVTIKITLPDEVSPNTCYFLCTYSKYNHVDEVSPNTCHCRMTFY